MSKLERKYFEIDEVTAKRAKEMMSFYEYIPNSKTADYKKLVDEVYDIVDHIAENRPKESERAYRLAERYAKKLADNYNRESRIGCMCPSVMISGAGNFPIRKKEKQNAAADRNHSEYQYIQNIKEKLVDILYGKEIIKCGDEDAIEKLEEKIHDMEQAQEKMKAVNAFYRKHKTLERCPDITEDIARKLDSSMKQSWKTDPKPYESWALSNNNQNIRSTKERLERLKAVKDRGTVENKNEHFKVVENTEIMRLQLIFEGKPDEEIRSVLKKHGFRWSPNNGAWQRQLTANAKFALKCVIEKLKKLEEEA